MKRFCQKRKKWTALAAGALFLCCALYAGRKEIYNMAGGRAAGTDGVWRVVIDAGHGGGKMRKRPRMGNRLKRRAEN